MTHLVLIDILISVLLPFKLHGKAEKISLKDIFINKLHAIISEIRSDLKYAFRNAYFTVYKVPDEPVSIDHNWLYYTLKITDGFWLMILTVYSFI